MNEKCGVFGAYSPGTEAARLAYYALWALQHRGQESSGITSSDGRKLYRHVNPGLVAHAYDETDLICLKGSLAIGHNRYSTSGGSDVRHSQPIVSNDGSFALAHNGNLPSTRQLEEFLTGHNIDTDDLNDTAMMVAAIEVHCQAGKTLPAAIIAAFPLFTGAFSCVAMDRTQLIAFRDGCGIRPLSVGKLEKGYAVSSETCAFDTIGAAFLRDVKPGEMVVIDQHGLRSHQIAKGRLKLDIFEYVYFARPDSLLLGRSVNEVRRRFGIQLAREFPLAADVVVPVPDSAIPAAVGYAQASGLPFDQALIKNRYIHRTFIRPSQAMRERDVALKLNPLPASLLGKRVVVIDDSIVRGTTTKKLVTLLYGAGAKAVHLLVSSPPVKYPDFYGVDTPHQEDLIAARLKIPEIRDYIGADSLGYLSYRGMIQATGLSESSFSTSCFSGVYPVDIRERSSEVIPVAA